MSLTLFRTELDVWQPGEHNGTFRGNNPAFVTAAAALREFWADSALEKQTAVRSTMFEERLGELAARHAAHVAEPRGRGMVWGLAFREPRRASQVADAAFTRGLLVETAGSDGEVVKIMSPLTSTDGELAEGFGILQDSMDSVLGS